jgi:hypothetical protein
MTTQFASDVVGEQLDLSQVLINNTITTPVFVVRSRRGKLTPMQVFDTAQVRKVCGIPNYDDYGITLPASLISMRRAGGAFYCRAIGAGYAFGAVLLAVNATNNTTVLIQTTAGQNPKDFDFAAAITAYANANSNAVLKPIALLPASGPGVYANTELKIGVVSSNLKIAAAPTFTAASGGTLTAGTYSYRIAPINQNGEVQASAAATHTLSAGDINAGNKSVKINWVRQEAATGYIIYGRAAGSESLLYIADASSSSYTDVGSALDTTLPANDMSRYTVDPTFLIQVYDMAQSKFTAQETYTCTIKDYIDGFNQNLNIVERLTDNSDRIDIVGYASTSYPTGSALPTIYSVAPTLMSGGADGATPTATDAANALTPFLNRDRYRINMIVDSGWNSKIFADAAKAVSDVQRAQYVLSVPQDSQDVTRAIRYRNTVLQHDSRRGCLFTPWLQYNDPDGAGRKIVPPAVYAADRMLFTDSIFSAGRSAAGLNRGVTDAIDVSNKDLYRYLDGERDALAKAQVNYFRVRNQGVTLWEQFTLQQQFSAASFININRIWDIIQNSLEDFLEYSLQEPNDDFLVRQISAALTGYLDLQVLARNIGAFAVYADERAENTNQSLSEGKRNVDVYLTPTLAARRIRCRTILTRQGAEFSTLLLAA